EFSPSPVNNDGSTKRRKLLHSQAPKECDGEDMEPETPTRTESEGYDVQLNAAQQVNTSNYVANMVAESHTSLEPINNNNLEIHMEVPGMQADNRTTPESQGNEVLNTMQVEECTDTNGITSRVAHVDAQSEAGVESTNLTKE